MLKRFGALPYYGPAGEDGSDPQVDDNTIDTGDEGGEGGSNEPQSLRQQIEKNFEADRKATAQQAEKSGNKKGGYTSRARQAAAEDGEDPAQQQQQQQAPQVDTQPPEAFTKEAKAEWANVPENTRKAILKREEDVARGVAELRQRYTDIDQAIAPYADQIRSGGRTPAQAVHQLFAWFNALANNPQEAFPALAKSFGYEMGQAQAQAQAQGQPGQPGQPSGQQPAGDVPPAVQQYITTIEQKLEQLSRAFQEKITGVEQTFAVQSQAKTQEVLDAWAKDKKYFGEVRQTMARLIQSGEIPLLSNGQVDLDKAYEVASWAVPEVRAKVMADQRAAEEAAAKQAADAERAAQQKQAEKARRAAVSAAGGAPGAPAGAPAAGRKGKGKSVRESILEAREMLES